MERRSNNFLLSPTTGSNQFIFFHKNMINVNESDGRYTLTLEHPVSGSVMIAARYEIPMNQRTENDQTGHMLPLTPLVAADVDRNNSLTLVTASEPVALLEEADAAKVAALADYDDLRKHQHLLTAAPIWKAWQSIGTARDAEIRWRHENRLGETTAMLELTALHSQLSVTPDHAVESRTTVEWAILNRTAQTIAVTLPATASWWRPLTLQRLHAERLLRDSHRRGFRNGTSRRWRHSRARTPAIGQSWSGTMDAAW